MKRAFLIFLIAVAAIAAQAQTSIPSSLYYTFPQVTTTGAVGAGLQFGSASQRPSNYTIDASVTGTAPSACTFRVEGSNDNTVWYGLDQTSPATNSCTTSYMEHITSKPVLYLRINVAAYTAGDGTTKVIFHYVGKQ